MLISAVEPPTAACCRNTEAFYAILNGQWEGRVTPIAVALTIWGLVQLIIGCGVDAPPLRAGLHPRSPCTTCSPVPKRGTVPASPSPSTGVVRQLVKQRCTDMTNGLVAGREKRL